MAFGKPRSDREEGSILSAVPSTSAAISVVPAGDANSSRTHTVITEGTKIVGTISFSGPAQINGSVEGEIIAEDRLVVSDSAEIKGKISGTEVVILGKVSGDVVASQRLTLKKPARLIGNITAPVLTIDEGVTFEGKCMMTAAQKNLEARPANVMSITGKVA